MVHSSEVEALAHDARMASAVMSGARMARAEPQLADRFASSRPAGIRATRI